MVIGLVVVMPDICGCGLDMGVVVWITKPYGALRLEAPTATPPCPSSNMTSECSANP